MFTTAHTREHLQAVLESLADGLKNAEGEDVTFEVYFQAPTTMTYPCIKYEPAPGNVTNADNVKYFNKKGYQVTVIDRDPDSPIRDAVEGLQHCRFDRYFPFDGLNHFVFTLYH